jgi:hypothetical protein
MADVLVTFKSGLKAPPAPVPIISVLPPKSKERSASTVIWFTVVDVVSVSAVTVPVPELKNAPSVEPGTTAGYERILATAQTANGPVEGYIYAHRPPDD